MIYDILDVFKKEYRDKGDNLVLGNYELKEGLYVKIRKDEKIEYFIVKKKNRELSFTDINGNLNFSVYDWFKERDYYSGYLNSNKSFYDKKIHSINYFSLFVKLESFISKEPKKVLGKDVIKNHFISLRDYKKFTKPKEKEILKNFQDYLSNTERRKNIDKKYKFIIDNLDSIVDIATEKNVKNYVKLFFDEDMDKYKQESKIYYSLKIFNDIGYCETIDEKTFGLSNSNMGLNSKKPFLEHKTKPLLAPFLIEKDDALVLKIFFDWLKIQPYKDDENKPKDRYLDDRFFMQKHSSNDEAEITDFDYVPSNEDKLENPIEVKNHLWLRSEKVLIEEYVIETLSHLEVIVDDIFYNQQLINNYYGEVWKKLDNSFSNFIYITRESMISYFRKYDDRNFYDVVNKYGSKIIVEHIKKERLFKAGLALNLKLSLIAYKGAEVMNIKQMQKKISENLMLSNYEELNNEEFFYLSGQVARYLLNQSKQLEKTGSMLEPFLKIKNPERLKETIRITYQKYKHEISLYFLKFNNAMSLILGYESEGNTNPSENMDKFLIGALSENLFYIKDEKNDTIEK